jgi:hypothetical protein
VKEVKHLTSSDESYIILDLILLLLQNIESVFVSSDPNRLKSWKVGNCGGNMIDRISWQAVRHLIEKDPCFV